MPRIVFLTEPVPLVGKVADWLAANTAPGWDFSDTILVVPTAGAGRRLRDQLFLRATRASAGVFPPRTITPLSLIDLGRIAPIASRQEQLAAWSEVLKKSDVSALLPGFTHPLSDGDALRVAGSLFDVCSLLGEAGLTPISPLLDQQLEHDAERWRQIGELYEAYRDRLATDGLIPTDLARISALEKPMLPAAYRRIVVAGVPDLNPLTRRYLARLEESGTEVIVLVDAPNPSNDALFDAWGCPDPTYWASLPLPIPLDHIQVVAEPFSEAQMAARLCARSHDVALCVTDERLIPALSAALLREGRATFDPRGEALGLTEVALVTQAWTKFCTSQLLGNLQVLVETPAFQRALGGLPAATVQQAYDTVRQETLMDSWPDVVEHYKTTEGDLAVFIQTIERWRKDFVRTPFFSAVQAFLTQLYADQVISLDSDQAQSLRKYGELLRSLSPARIPEQLAPELLRDAVAQTPIYHRHPDDAIELNGWLEASWLPESRLVLTGAIESILPASTSGHAFLPDSAREALGLATNATRYARDAFLLHNHLFTRAEVRFLLSRETAEGEAARPSRFFFRCPDDELAVRVESLFCEVPSLRQRPARRRGWKLAVPRTKPPAFVRVTGFGDYLACPLRFYFKHVLRLESPEAQTMEMNARQFGTVFHSVVEAFARDEAVRNSDDASAIARHVISHLDRIVFARHGRNPSLPVRVQQESLRARLRRFAELQAAERAAGWKIIEAEYRFDADDTLSLGGLPVTAGLDRIEIHEKTGQRRILDYKTFARDKSPEKTHLTMSRPEIALPGEEVFWKGKPHYWQNLQLPLYRALSRYRWPEDEEAPLLGYFLLPERLEDSRVEEFPLDDFTGLAAVRCAEALAERVRRGIFWPPREVAFDDFEMLFQGENPAGALSEESIAFLQGDAP